MYFKQQNPDIGSNCEERQQYATRHDQVPGFVTGDKYYGVVILAPALAEDNHPHQPNRDRKGCHTQKHQVPIKRIGDRAKRVSDEGQNSRQHAEKSDVPYARQVFMRVTAARQAPGI